MISASILARQEATKFASLAKMEAEIILLPALSQLWPSLGDWIIRRQTR
jgi:hypothetical protein